MSKAKSKQEDLATQLLQAAASLSQVNKAESVSEDEKEVEAVVEVEKATATEKLDESTEVAKAEEMDKDKEEEEDEDEEELKKAMDCYTEDCNKAMPEALAKYMGKKGMTLKAMPSEDGMGTAVEESLPVNKSIEVSAEAIEAQTQSIVAAMQPAIDAAFAQIAASIAEQSEVLKSVAPEIETLKGQSVATLEFQTRSIPVLESFKEQLDAANKNIETLGNLPQPRRSLGADVVVQKSNTVVQPSTANMQPLYDWARGSLDTADRLEVFRQAEAGNFAQVPAHIQAQIGVK